MNFFLFVLKQNLEAEVKSEVSGNYWNLLWALLKSPAEFAAHSLKKAMKGAGTNENALIEVICTTRHRDLQIIKEKYEKNFGKNVIEDIEDDLSGDLKDLMVALLERPKSPENIDVKEAKEDVKLVRDSFEAESDSESKLAKTLIEIFKTRSRMHLRFMIDLYKEEYGTDIESDIESKVDKDLALAFNSISNFTVFFLIYKFNRHIFCISSPSWDIEQQTTIFG